jgi:glycosyltransferase involved in cell wall biosynthesis
MKISAVIPVRNRADYIGRAIESALEQTFPLSEIVVVDDGSADRTVEIAKSFNDTRVRIIQQDGRGACAARNRGWQATNAEWIGFLDSDDIWMPSKIEAQVACCNAGGNFVACFTGFTEIGHGTEYDQIPSTSSAMLINLRKGNGLGPTSCCLVRRSALETIGGWDESLQSCQDWDLWLRLREVGEFGIVPKPLVKFEQRSNGRISRNIDHVVTGHNIISRRITQHLKGHEKRLVAAMHAAHMSDLMHDFGRRKDAIHFAMKSILLRPNRYALWVFLDRLTKRNRSV